MKTYFFQTLLLICFGLPTISQNLAEIYKAGTVHLEAVTYYGTENNWNELFADYEKFAFGKHIGKYKKIVIAPDGSIFMSHKTRHEIWKFDKDGNFIKKFGKKGSGPGQFIMLPGVQGILDNQFLYTNDVHGRMMFFDLDGNYIKTLKLDYMPLGTTPLKGREIAILGHVPWKGQKSKKILVIKDFDTGKGKTIWYEFEEYCKSRIIINIPKGGMMSCSLPFTHPSLTRFRMSTSKEGNLILASPKDGIMTEFSPEGEKLNSFQLNIEPLQISDEDIMEYFETGKSNFSKFEKSVENNLELSEDDKKNIIEQYRQQIDKFKDNDLYPKHLPYFSTLMVDSNGNILVFEFTKEEKTNRFRVYSFDTEGNFLCTSTFDAPGYKLNLSGGTFVFHNGFVYAVAEKENGGEIPLRLVKFKITK